ncbi:LPS export ABC transporter periplasmic protein LptC [Porphyromonas gingivalis]|uniref:LPS export ABC transporter periplasmic protein LptC n=1 Tax=Porphyromonas gingivalis TaxID=837 RepID=UPI000BE72335|nr:LPS export ABC transporter periplasmic protein LptC [Porphyromonas gingivalis]PDP83638.1 LPS export ABC transporter periplasmic protein LptC [Porphyromonas gingivalis]
MDPGQRIKTIKNTTLLLSGAVVVFFCFLSFAACRRGKTEVVKHDLNLDSAYSMHTTDVNTLISDSGLVQFRMKAKDWFIYDRGEKPHWLFPNGIYVERFDTLNHILATIVADTAYYMIDDDRFILIGHAHIRNMNDENFHSPRFIWDKKNAIVYSDDTVYIQSPDKILRGTSFTATQDMGEYTIFNHSGDYYVSEEEDKSADTIPIRQGDRTAKPTASPFMPRPSVSPTTKEQK